MQEIAVYYLRNLLRKQGVEITENNIEKKRKEIIEKRKYIAQTTPEIREKIYHFNHLAANRKRYKEITAKKRKGKKEKAILAKKTKKEVRPRIARRGARDKIISPVKIVEVVREKFPQLSEDEILSNNNLIEFAKVKINNMKTKYLILITDSSEELRPHLFTSKVFKLKDAEAKIKEVNNDLKDRKLYESDTLSAKIITMHEYMNVKRN